MKKAVALCMLLALVIGYGATALASGGPPNIPEPTHECWIEWECFEFGCYYAKCCEDCVWVKKKGVGSWVCETTCMPIF